MKNNRPSAVSARNRSAAIRELKTTQKVAVPQSPVMVIRFVNGRIRRQWLYGVAASEYLKSL